MICHSKREREREIWGSAQRGLGLQGLKVRGVMACGLELRASLGCGVAGLLTSPRLKLHLAVLALQLRLPRFQYLEVLQYG